MLRRSWSVLPADVDHRRSTFQTRPVSWSNCRIHRLTVSPAGTAPRRGASLLSNRQRCGCDGCGANGDLLGALPVLATIVGALTLVLCEWFGGFWALCRFCHRVFMVEWLLKGCCFGYLISSARVCVMRIEGGYGAPPIATEFFSIVGDDAPVFGCAGR